MANPVTHLEKTIAGEVQPVTHLEHVIAEYGGGNVYENLEAGTNILIEETSDGKAKISASGEVSSEDTVARAAIAEMKDGETLDSFGDVETALIGKADTSDIPTVPITAIQKNGTGITPVSGTVNITVPTTAADVSALPDTTKYAAALSLTINSSTFVMTGQLKDQNGDNLGTAQTIDLPLESVVVNGSYNSQTKKVVLTLQNGNTIEFSVADLVSGLQTELSASNKLNPAYINYDSTHRAVSDTEKSTWNGKQNAIDSSHRLSADLVDDTNATNKFATAEELEQIQTNKNNILTVEKSQGQKNIVNVSDSSGTTWIDINVSLSAGNYALYFGNITTNAIGTTCQIATLDSGTIKQYFRIGRGDNVAIPFVLTDSITTIRLYAGEDYAGSNGKNISYTDMMICDKAYYDGGMMDYQPYSMTLSEITAWILSHS